MVSLSAQITTHVANILLVNGVVVLFHKLFAVVMTYIAVHMVMSATV